MKTKTIIKIPFLLGLIGLLLCFNNNGYAVVLDNPKDKIQQKPFMQQSSTHKPPLNNPVSYHQADEKQSPQYAPGQVLVKFKEGTNPQSIIAEAQIAPKNFQRMHSIKPFTARFRKNYKVTKGPSGKFSLLGKSYKDINAVTDDEIFKEAYKNAPEMEKSLYRSYKINLPEGITVEEAISKLKNNPNVEYAEPNGIVKAQMAPNDPYYNSSNSWGQGYDDLWGIKKIQCGSAWDIAQGQGVVVAVIDTGVDYTHPDLAANIWTNPGEIPNNGIDDDGNGYIDDVKGYDFCAVQQVLPDGTVVTKPRDNDPMDGYGHGSHVAGTVAAVGNNTAGVIGVAPQAKIMAVKGLSDYGYGYISDLADCVIYAADNGAKVLSNSWGGAGASQILTDVFHYAYSRGCVCVAAAGNSSADVYYFSPANIDTVIAVSASNHNDEFCFFSNFGSKIDVSAPGGGFYSSSGGEHVVYDLLSTMPDNSTLAAELPSYLKVSNGYWLLAGTSMACPHVAGVAALIFSKDPTLTNDQVRQRIQATADDVGDPGKDIYFGYGRVNAYNAMAVDVGMSSPVSNSFLHGSSVVIKGIAAMAQGFQRYELWYAPVDNPNNAFQIPNAPDPQNKILGVWDISNCPDGKYLLTLKVIDTNNKTYTASITVTVDNQNEPPMFKDFINNRGIVIDRMNQFKIEAADPDDPTTPQGQLAYSADNLPAGAQFNPATQIFSWQPGASDKGIYEITFTASDNANSISRAATLRTVVIEETLLTYPHIKLNPGVYDNKIVWEEFLGLEQFALTLYDIPTGRTTRIRTASYLDQSNIYGNRIVWSEGRNMGLPDEDCEIYMYNISTRRISRVTNNPNYQRQPSVYGNKIVWLDARDGYQGNIYMYDISTGRTTGVVCNGDTKNNPIIYGNNIVWTNGYSSLDIYMYNLTTGASRQITTSPANQWAPDIYEDKIVWADDRNETTPQTGNWDVYMYNLTTSEERQITTHPSTQFEPRIYGDKIICRDWRNSDNFYYFDIYMSDVSTDTETRITTAPFNLGGYDIYENKIVWCYYDENGDYLYIDKFYFVPRITSIVPATAFPGATLTITGKNFGYHKETDSNVVFPNGINAAVTSWSNNQIVCTVPANASSGSLYAVTRGGMSNSVNFALPQPLDWYPNAPNSANQAVYIQGVSHSGTRSVKVIDTVVDYTFWYGEAINFNSPYPKTFAFSGWAKGQSITSSSWIPMYYCIIFEDNTTNSYYFADLMWPTGSYNWKKKSITYTFNKRVKSIRPYLQLYGKGTVWFDDISISLPGGANLVLNPGMEQSS